MKALGLLLVTFVSVCQAESAAARAVGVAHREFLAAALAGDAAVLNKLLADDVQFSHANGLVDNKQQAVQGLLKLKPRFEIAEQSVKVYGHSATVRGRMTGYATGADGKPIVLPLSYLQLWLRQGGQWRMVQRQTTRLPD